MFGIKEVMHLCAFLIANPDSLFSTFFVGFLGVDTSDLVRLSPDNSQNVLSSPTPSTCSKQENSSVQLMVKVFFRCGKVQFM